MSCRVLISALRTLFLRKFMAYAKAKLSDLKQSLADRHDGGTLPTDTPTLSLWTRHFNRGQEYCANELELKKSTSVVTSGGTGALPTDFKTILDVYDSGDNLMVQVSPDDIGSQASGTYWITGDHNSGFTLNVIDDDTYTVKYVFLPAPLVNESDECIISDPEAVVAYAYSMVRKSETDPIGDAQEAMIECNTRLKRVKSDYDNNNANTEMSMEI